LRELIGLSFQRVLVIAVFELVIDIMGDESGDAQRIVLVDVAQFMLYNVLVLRFVREIAID